MSISAFVKLFAFFIYFDAGYLFITVLSCKNNISASIPNWLRIGHKFFEMVGGNDAEDAIPWQVSLRYPKDKQNAILPFHPICDEKECTPYLTNCGGVIVDELTILSAAHCFVGTDQFGSKYNTTKLG